MVSGVGNRCMMSHWIQYIILYYYIRLKPSHQLGKLPGIRRSRGEAAPCICNLAADFGELWVGNGSENGDGNHAMALLMGKMMINSASQYIFQPWQKTMIDAHPNSRLLSFASLYNRKLWGNWAKQQPATGGLVPRMVYFISFVYCLYFIHEHAQCHLAHGFRSPSNSAHFSTAWPRPEHIILAQRMGDACHESICGRPTSGWHNAYCHHHHQK